ncbi:MAG: hypothetical protein R3B70_31695 [Polyangiaceae bacterium]
MREPVGAGESIVELSEGKGTIVAVPLGADGGSVRVRLAEGEVVSDPLRRLLLVAARLYASRAEQVGPPGVGAGGERVCGRWQWGARGRFWGGRRRRRRWRASSLDGSVGGDCAAPRGERGGQVVRGAADP